MENERVARLEVQMKELIGNGQPGRVDKMESKVEGLSKAMYVGLGGLYLLHFLAANGLLNFKKLLGG